MAYETIPFVAKFESSNEKGQKFVTVFDGLSASQLVLLLSKMGINIGKPYFLKNGKQKTFPIAKDQIRNMEIHTVSLLGEYKNDPQVTISRNE